MKIGIIVIFNNNSKAIDIEVISKYIQPLNDMILCLVDNQSKDSTIEKLKEIKENCTNVDVVEIKKQSSQETAKRAGARFMFNTYNLKHLGFIDANTSIKNNLDINKAITLVCQNKESILEFNINLKKQATIKQTLFKSIFSVLDILKQNEFKITNNTTYLSTI